MKLTIGQRIRIGRIKHDLTQAELAKRIGISENSLCQIERGGTANPHMSTLIALADTLHVTLDYLVGRDEPTESASAARES